jgi:hypothetical protein
LLAIIGEKILSNPGGDRNFDSAADISQGCWLIRLRLYPERFGWQVSRSDTLSLGNGGDALVAGIPTHEPFGPM